MITSIIIFIAFLIIPLKIINQKTVTVFWGWWGLTFGTKNPAVEKCWEPVYYLQRCEQRSHLEMSYLHGLHLDHLLCFQLSFISVYKIWHEWHLFTVFCSVTIEVTEYLKRKPKYATMMLNEIFCFFSSKWLY